jgi:hypothetical protein
MDGASSLITVEGEETTAGGVDLLAFRCIVWGLRGRRASRLSPTAASGFGIASPPSSGWPSWSRCRSTKSWTVYHASHHISLALAAMGLNDKERMPLYRQHRTLLRNGQWRRVVQELSEIAQGDPENPCSGVVQSIGRTGCQATPPSQDRRPLRLDVGAAEDECQR